MKYAIHTQWTALGTALKPRLGLLYIRVMDRCRGGSQLSCFSVVHALHRPLYCFQCMFFFGW